MQAHYWLVLQLVFPTSQLILTILYNFEPSTRNVSFCIGHHEEPKIIFQCWLRIYWQNIHWFDIFPFGCCNNVENIKSSTTHRTTRQWARWCCSKKTIQTNGVKKETRKGKIDFWKHWWEILVSFASGLLGTKNFGLICLTYRSFQVIFKMLYAVLIGVLKYWFFKSCWTLIITYDQIVGKIVL